MGTPEATLVQRFLYWLTGHLRCRLINGRDGSRDMDNPYLERYFLATWLGCFAYIHRFMESDHDIGVHDHPFGWSFSLILSGGYVEFRMIGIGKDGLILHRRLVRPCRINRIGPHTFHRVELVNEREAWSLFVHGPRIKKWGFLRTTAVKGGLHYTPDVPGEGGYPWWKSAPRGLDVGREPAA